MTYEQLQSRIFCRANRHNGYNCSVINIGFALDGTRVMCVADCGAYWSGFSASTEEEVISALTTMPSQYWDVTACEAKEKTQ